MFVRARILKEPINTLSNSDLSLRTLTINEEKWARLGEIELLLKEAANNAINKLKDYYNKTDTTLYSASLNPRLKLEYMKDNEWEKRWIDKTKNDVSEIYNTLYAPQEIQNISIEYNSSNEDLVSYISK
ncbi:unnamed protein product [Rhizophagus irregularis]|uniref:Uncharacterized protein n=1 Tax=Rhizophagus irregularis TaxID=588596 RepID=A0A915ZNN7_9GLOM|nr:unnamed protein product [Rhizophagus irregularis]